MELTIFFWRFVSSSPSFIGWLAAVIIAIILVSRGGRAPEKLVLAGFSIMLFKTILSIPISGIFSMPYLYERYGLSRTDISLFYLITNLSLEFLILAGIICIIIGFWLAFRAYRVQQVKGGESHRQ